MKRPLRALIVEDEILIALELESLLQDADHEVVGVATSSRQALSRARYLHPDLVLVDIHLTDGPTGIDVARRLSGELGATVLFVTANMRQIPADRAGARGAIAKPYTERGVRQALAYIATGTEGARRPVPPTEAFVPFEAGMALGSRVPSF